MHSGVCGTNSIATPPKVSGIEGKRKKRMYLTLQLGKEGKGTGYYIFQTAKTYIASGKSLLRRAIAESGKP